MAFRPPFGDQGGGATPEPTGRPESDLPYYRLYFLDASGRISEMAEMECVDDAEALARAEPYLEKGRAMELWNQARFVRRFEPAAKAA